MLTTLNTSKV